MGSGEEVFRGGERVEGRWVQRREGGGSGGKELLQKEEAPLQGD